MYEYNISQWIFFFYLYCFFGWCFESTYVSIKSKKLVNRGFLRGPFLPLYGSGGMMMLVVSAPFQDNLLLTYVAGCVGATVLEYITGVTMESLFKVRYWDYSYKKLNFQGHICLSSTLAWGGLTIAMTSLIHPFIEKEVLSIPGVALSAITVLLTVIITFDFALSFKAAMDLRDILIHMEHLKEELVRLQKRADVYIAIANEEWEHKVARAVEDAVSVLELKDSVEERFDQLKTELKEKPAAYVETAKEEIDELIIKYRTNMEKLELVSTVKDFYKKNMIRHNPTMTSKIFQSSFDEVKRILFQKDEEEQTSGKE